MNEEVTSTDPVATDPVIEPTPVVTPVTVTMPAPAEATAATVVLAAAPDETLGMRMHLWVSTFERGALNTVAKGIADAEAAVKAFENYFHKA